MPRGRATKILLLVGLLAVLVVGVISFGSREELGRDNALADYLVLRYDLGDDLSYRAVTDARSEELNRADIEACLGDGSVDFDWDGWTEATRSPALDAPILSNPFAGTSDVFRPVAPDVVELLGMGWERRAFELELDEAALVEAASVPATAQACFASAQRVDARPELAIELDAALQIGLATVRESDGDAIFDETRYATCMSDRGFPVERSDDFAEQTAFLVGEYRAAWSDAPVDGRDAGPTWAAIREREIDLSLDDAACRSQLIGDVWEELADVLDQFNSQFSDELAELQETWAVLVAETS